MLVAQLHQGRPALGDQPRENGGIAPDGAFGINQSIEPKINGHHHSPDAGCNAQSIIPNPSHALSAPPGYPADAWTSPDLRWIPVSKIDVITSRREMPDAAALASPCRICWIASRGRGRTEARMVPFFVQIKCQLGKSYEVANKLADAELASEIYSTAGDFDLLVKFYVEEKTDIGHFVNEKVQTIPGIQDTRTIITFKAF
jgi:DNA-binding Lrp family transcriptional regulator